MKYEEARDLIETGDLISVISIHSFFGWLTKIFTGKYSHSGVAVWLQEGLWLCEINGGRNHLIPLSQLENLEFDVFNCPNGLDRTVIKETILTTLRSKVDYGYFAAIATGILEFFGVNIFIHWRNYLHCAGYVVKIYELAGWTDHSRIVSPTKLSKELQFKFSVNQ